MSDISRRTFLTTTVAGAGLTIVPRHVLGRGLQAPSDTVHVATVGFGGMGGSNTRRLMTQNIVAICDVDDALVDAQLKRMEDDAAKTPAVVTIISDTQAKYSRTIDVLDALAVARIDNVTFTVAEEE